MDHIVEHFLSSLLSRSNDQDECFFFDRPVVPDGLIKFLFYLIKIFYTILVLGTEKTSI